MHGRTVCCMWSRPRAEGGGPSGTVKLVEDGDGTDGDGGLAGPLSKVLLICERNTTAHHLGHPSLHECVQMMELANGHAGLDSSRTLPPSLTPTAIGAERKPASRLWQDCNEPRCQNGERLRFHQATGMRRRLSEAAKVGNEASSHPAACD